MQSNGLRDVLAGVGSAGSVQPHLEDFAADLTASGYAVLSTRAYVVSVAHFGRWLDAAGLAIDSLTDESVVRFGEHSCACPGASRHGRSPSRRYVARVQRFVAYLRSRCVVLPEPAEQPPVTPSPLIGFRAWMMDHRGVTKRTIDRYEDLIERMLPALGSDSTSYDAGRVRRVLLDEVRQRSCGYAKSFVSGLRAFLRFLEAQGRCRAHLHRAVPAVRQWTLSALPRHLEADDVERVIDSCDRTQVLGMRDRAVLLLLARLGLRAGDIVAMRLDDLDWEKGTLRVRGKGRKEICLPLPQDAGDALAEYLLSARPSAHHEQVFLCVNAPPRSLATSAAVSMIVRFAIERAGITDPPSKGAHLLRYSAATAMLRSGASLDAIATVLRHESTDMTAYYAKVDVELLQLVAQPWPEGATC